MIFTATTLFGLEKFVGEDIDTFGYRRIETIDGRVTFEAPPEAAAVCNIGFRCAERLYVNLGDFDAPDFNSLFEGVRALPWESFIGSEDEFPVSGHSVKSRLFSIPDCQKIVKKAVVTRLQEAHGVKVLPETGVRYRIEFFILNDRATLMIDTSGDGLHKRGYRPEANAAPIRETLAAAMVLLSRPREDVIFVDPMCGSGTVAIEAALIDCRIAPGLNRRFAAESFPAFPKRMWDDARAAARAAVRPPQRRIYGRDIDPEAVALSCANAKRAGVGHIDFAVSDVADFESPVSGARGTIVCNPPYGERMLDRRRAEELYSVMGRVFAQKVPGWQIYIISSDPDFERYYGAKADKVRRMYNGMIKCGLYQYFRKKG